MISGALAFILAQIKDPNVNLLALRGGFVRVTSKDYAVEVPQSWTVGTQTPWGARSITPAKAAGTELGVMTAGVTKQS